MYIMWTVQAIGIVNTRFQPFDIDMPDMKGAVCERIQWDGVQRFQTGLFSKQEQFDRGRMR
jgi:hypothetical protein